MLRSMFLLALSIALLLWIPGLLISQQIGMLAGKVVDGDEKPVLAATVRILGTSTVKITKQDGSFLVPDLAPGNYEVFITAVGHQEYRASVIIRADYSTSIKVRLHTRALMTNGVKIVRKSCPGAPEPFGTVCVICRDKLESSAWPGLFGGVP